MFYISLLTEAGIKYESIWMTANPLAGARLYFHCLHTLSHLLSARQMPAIMPKSGEHRRKMQPRTSASAFGGGNHHFAAQSYCPNLGSLEDQPLRGPASIIRGREAAPESSSQPEAVSQVALQSLPGGAAFSPRQRPAQASSLHFQTPRVK